MDNTKNINNGIENVNHGVQTCREQLKSVLAAHRSLVVPYIEKSNSFMDSIEVVDIQNVTEKEISEKIDIKESIIQKVFRWMK